MIDIFSLTFYHTNVVINVILISAFILNLIFAFTIIFMERRSAGSIWAMDFSITALAYTRFYYLFTISDVKYKETYFLFR
ncbi:cardiolipin synthetase [Staphylococcus gallinarum]|uniref:Cardiolipin synthetase n=1 Tax=Staphylococcus gallinarum TaxID=1293 RepID=A0A380FJB5_STAGA|nr:cardiolipin synthetase [Staphylococcus gallinarum]